MQCRKREVAGLGNPQCRFDCFQIAHFTNQNNIRILAQRCSQCLRKSLRIGIDLALIHYAVLVVVKELDRIFDRQDMFVALSVDLINHCRERC